jgi:hypothetical protein
MLATQADDAEIDAAIVQPKAMGSKKKASDCSATDRECERLSGQIWDTIRKSYAADGDKRATN